LVSEIFEIAKTTLIVVVTTGGMFSCTTVLLYRYNGIMLVPLIR